MTGTKGRIAASALALLLSACSVGGQLPPPAVEDDAVAPAPRVAGHDATSLALSAWEPDGTPGAMLLAVHGYGDYGPSTFSQAAPTWTERGLLVWAYDQRGFGRNASRGFWPGTGALVDDLVAVAGSLRRMHPCRTLAVVGHSMGGGVALAAAPELEARGLADALVLAAPAIWGGAALNPLQRVAAWSAAAVAPDTRISGRGVVRIQASDNIEALRALGRDPLYLSPPSARELLGLVRVVDRAAEAASDTRLPALLLLGEKDQIVPNAAVARVFARLPGPRSVRRYEDGWHLLFRDLQAERVADDVADWVLARPGPGGCLSSSGR